MAALTAFAGKLETLLSGSLASALGTGQEFALVVSNSGVPFIGWQTIFTGGNPASILIALEGSQDGTSWSAIDTSTNVNGEVRALNGTYKFIRVNNSAVSGGSGVTLTVYFTYSRSELVGGSADPGAVNSVSVTIPSANVKALKTTAYHLLTDPPAGFAYVPVAIMAYKAAGSAAYAVSTNVLNIQSRTGGLVILNIANAQFKTLMETTAAGSMISLPFAGAVVTITTTNGLGVGIDAQCTVSDPTLGDSNLTIVLYYRKIPLIP